MKLNLIIGYGTKNVTINVNVGSGEASFKWLGGFASLTCQEVSADTLISYTIHYFGL